MSMIKVEYPQNFPLHRIYKLLDEYGEYFPILEIKDYCIIVKYFDVSDVLELDGYIVANGVLNVKEFNNKKTKIIGIMQMNNVVNISERSIVYIFYHLIRRPLRYIKKISGDSYICELDVTGEIEDNYNLGQFSMAKISGMLPDNIKYSITYEERPVTDDNIIVPSSLDRARNKKDDEPIIEFFARYETKKESGKYIYNIPNDIIIPFDLVDVIEFMSRIILPADVYVIKSSFVIQISLIVAEARTIRIYISEGIISSILAFEQGIDKSDIHKLLFEDSKIDLYGLLIKFVPYGNLSIVNVYKRNKEAINKANKELSKLKLIKDNNEIKLSNIDIFNFTVILETTPIKTQYHELIFNVSEEDISDKKIGEIFSNMDKILRSLRQELNKILKFYSYVARVSELKWRKFVKKDNKLHIHLGLYLQLITNEDYYDTIGLYETELSNICTHIKDKKKKLYKLAEKLHTSVSHLTNENEMCKYLNEYLDELNYSDFA